MTQPVAPEHVGAWRRAAVLREWIIMYAAEILPFDQQLAAAMPTLTDVFSYTVHVTEALALGLADVVVILTDRLERLYGPDALGLAGAWLGPFSTEPEIEDGGNLTPAASRELLESVTRRAVEVADLLAGETGLQRGAVLFEACEILRAESGDAPQ